MAVSADRYRTLRLTRRGHDLMAGRIEEVMLAIPDVHRARVGRALPARGSHTRRRLK